MPVVQQEEEKKDIDLQQQLYDARTENAKLQEDLYWFQSVVQELTKEKKKGKVLINIKQVMHDIKFMDFSGERFAYFIYDDEKFVKLDPLEKLNNLDPY